MALLAQLDEIEQLHGDAVGTLTPLGASVADSGAADAALIRCGCSGAQ
jgi:hypothetical protein